MAVEFVCARTEAESAGYVLSRIKAQVEKDPLARVIVLVPPQATLTTENHIMRALSLHGLMGVWVMGPQKLTQRIFETVYGRARPTIDMPGKSMVLRRIMGLYGNELAVLGAAVHAQNICMDIAGVIAEMKSMDITPEQIASLGSENGAAGPKLKDLAFLYEKFEETLKDHALTGEDCMNIAAEHVRDCRFIAESDVYILDFGLYTTQMARMVGEIAQTAKNTAVTFLDTHPGDADADLFAPARRERALLQKAAGGAKLVFLPPSGRRQGEAAHVAQNLYAYPHTRLKNPARDVQIIRALDPAQEVAAAAEAIAQLHTKEGIAMGAIAVALGNVSEYETIIKEKFTQASIPFFLDDQRSAQENFIARFLLSALRMAGGRLSKERLLAHIESAFGPGDGDVSVLKNYAFENISGAYGFTHPFADGKAEAARLRCAVPALHFKKRAAAAKTAGELIDLLFAYMLKMGIEERLAAQTEEFIRLELFESAEYFEKAYQKIGEVLEQAKEILKDTEMSPFELADILKSGFEAASIRLIPQGADEVAVGQAGVLRLQDVRALVLLGVNEGKIPNYEEETGILTPAEKEYIMEEILGRPSLSPIERQKLAIYRLLSLPVEKMIFSYHDFSPAGQQQPSSLITRLHEIMDISEESAAQHLGVLRENAMMRAAEELKELADGHGGQEHPYLAAMLAREETRETVLKYERFAARTYAAGQMDKKYAGELYGMGTASVSRYETYFSCPFRHYVLYGLQPRLPRESGIEYLDVGNYVHKVLDGVSKKLKAAGKGWDKATDGELYGLLCESARSARTEEIKYTLDKKNENTLSLLEQELHWALLAIRRQFETSCLTMEETEHHFEMDIAGVRMGGVIDRLDLARIGEETLFKVVDYKTGEKSWSLQDFYEGLALQLVIYMLAGLEYFKQRFPNAQAAGADYFTVKLPLTEVFDPDGVMDKYKMKGLQALAPQEAKQVYGYDGKNVVSLSLRIKKDGAYYAADAKDVYTQKEIGRLMAYAKTLVARAAGEIAGGCIEIGPRPNEKNTLPCTYCDFRSICLIDETDIPDRKEKKTRSDILRHIAEKTEGGGLFDHGDDIH